MDENKTIIGLKSHSSYFMEDPEKLDENKTIIGLKSIIFFCGGFFILLDENKTIIGLKYSKHKKSCTCPRWK